MTFALSALLRRTASALVLSTALLLASTATATQGIGTDLQLLAVSGERHRIATLVEISVLDECAEGCRVYQVDIEQPGFTRLHERRVTDAGGADRFERLARLMTAYQAALPEAQRAVLARNLLPPFELTRLDTTMNAGAVVATHRGRSIRATLSLLWSVPSMNRYDQTPLGRSCVDQDRALCSACKPAVRWVNGDALPSWQCSAKGIRLDPQEGEAAAACFCAARGHMYGLTVSASGAAQGATGANANRVVTTLSRPGSKVLVEPHQTLQMLSEQPVAGHWDDDTMLSYDGSNSSVEFLVTPEGFALVVGTAVHQGSSNSTRYPVFGAIGP